MDMSAKLMDHVPPKKKSQLFGVLEPIASFAIMRRAVARPSMKLLESTCAVPMIPPVLISMIRMVEAKLAAAQMAMNAKLMDHALPSSFKPLT